MNVIIVGCGRIGTSLAYNLFKRGHKVSVIDENPIAFNNLPNDFKGKTLEGTGMDQDALERAGIENCDAFAAVTNNDALNAVLCHVAKSDFHVPNVVARNYHPKFRPIFESFNIQVISSTSWGAQRIEELLDDERGDAVFSAGNGEVEIYELIVPRAWHGRRVDELVTGPECKWLAITRAGSAFLSEENSVLETGDILTVAATFNGITTTRENLSKRQEP